MGLLDCVSDKSAKYPVNPPAQAPMERSMSKRRSMGLFASNTSLKGHRDIDFWRHRLLGFLFKSEGREDVGNLRMPLKQMGYVTIGDFIRDIPFDIYEPYRNQLTPDTGLRKDYKVIWERDGIAEPGILKWEGTIEGQRCMGLQLDRKKAVPFGIHDGKGLFFCKPGHRALVPVDEVFAYKSFLRQFIGSPRKDSMPLNLLPGRSSVRVAVAKQYKPGDRVHLPTEGKWATILWTGRIEGEWVVDLVYDPEKPATGRMASPDEPCMSRSLSMAEFIDQVGLEDHAETLHSPTSPKHVPPPPPMTPPPKSPELEDEVFIEQRNKPATAKRNADDVSESESETSEAEEEDSISEEESHSDEIHSAIEPPASSSSESETETRLNRTASEPGPNLSKLTKKQQHKKLEKLEQPPLESKSTHKPMFNLASLGRRKSSDKKAKPKPAPRQQIASPTNVQQSPKKGFSLFSKGKSKVKKADEDKIETFDEKNDVPTSFTRRDRSRSPVHKKPDKRNWSEEHNEVPVDVPPNLRSPKSSTTDKPKVASVRLSSNETDSIPSPKPRSPDKVAVVPPPLPTVEPPPLPTVEPPPLPTVEPPMSSKYSSDSYESSDEEQTKEVHVEVDVELVKPEREPSECSSDTTPPYSPVIKDVGFKMSKPSSKTTNRSSPFRSFGALFSSKKKVLPPRDYKEVKPNPPTRKESMEQKDKSDTDTASHSSVDTENDEPRRNSSRRKNHDGLFRRSSKTHESIGVDGHQSPQKLVDTVQMGDQEGLVLDSLEVKDDQAWSNTPPLTSPEVVPTKRRGSKGKPFSFGFSKKQKPMEEFKASASIDTEDVSKDLFQEDSELVSVGEDTSRQPEPKQKRSSFRDSFTRTFSFSKGKTRHESLGEEKQSRPDSLYIDNNEAIGVTKMSRPKSKSALVLVDIQPWNERKGYKNDIYQDSPEEAPPRSPGSPKPPPALLPKQPDPVVPKHRIFTTPIGLFGLGQKSSDPPKPKKSSFKGSKVPKLAQKSPITEAPHPEPTLLPPLPKIVPPTKSPPPVPVADEAPSPTVRHLKSALKQRKEIEAIPKGVKVGDRVIWYNGRIPIPGTVMKLYKDGTDKYTAVVKFDRLVTSEPLSLAREGDDYVVTVEELLTPEILGLPLSPVPTSTPVPVQFAATPEPPIYQNKQEILQDILEEDCKSPTVRFSSPEPPLVPEINVDLASPSDNLELPPIDDDGIPPPFQEEEIEIACGTRRGIPSRDQKSCLETILFAMFYTANTFDTSLLYGSNFEQDSTTRDVRMLLRDEIVTPLRQSAFCEADPVVQLKALMQTMSSDFNSMSSDAEIMTFLLFDRALKLGKFISYSNGMTDYLHQLVLDPKDLSKGGTLQQLFENSLEQMDNCKLKTSPSPALIIEIPRANDKLVHYEAVIPSLTINISHLLQNGPRLCICGMVAKYECLKCIEKSGDTALVYCDNCTSMADQIHFQLIHTPVLVQITQTNFSMDLVSVICVKEGHYTAFVKCGSQRSSPWLFYDAAEADNPKVSLEQNLGMWIDRLEKYPGKYHEAFVHPLLTHFLSDSHICIYQPREKSSLV